MPNIMTPAVHESKDSFHQCPLFGASIHVRHPQKFKVATTNSRVVVSFGIRFPWDHSFAFAVVPLGESIE